MTPFISIVLTLVLATLSGPTILLKVDPATQIDPKILQEEVSARLGEYSVILTPSQTAASFTVSIQPAQNSPNAVSVQISAGTESILNRTTSIPQKPIPAARQLAVLIEGPIRRVVKSLQAKSARKKTKQISQKTTPTQTIPVPASKPAPKKTAEVVPSAVEKQAPSPQDEKPVDTKETKAPQNPDTQIKLPRSPKTEPGPAMPIMEFDIRGALGYLPRPEISFAVSALSLHRQWLPYLGTSLEFDLAVNTSRGASSVPLTSHELGAALLLTSSLHFSSLIVRGGLGPLVVSDFVSRASSFSFSSAAQVFLVGSRGYIETRIPLFNLPFQWVARIEGDFHPKSPRYTWKGEPVESRGPLRVCAYLGIGFPITN